ncbi:MAG: FAD-binding protein [Coriobacteriia bacterium]|nr:FAD-binding protein [Coriobacteriia bacterium]MBS5477489.1 FAD-binding protein [Coriobacteriia bacterium]
MGIIEANVTRRQAVGAAGVACAAAVLGSGVAHAAEPAAPAAADAVETCDVVVVGLGASGMLAAIGAADAGASVIALDAAAGFTSTTNTKTTGSFFVEGSAQLAEPWHLTKQDAYDYMMEGTHYSENSPLVRNMIEVSGRAVDLMEDGGVVFTHQFEGATADSPVATSTGYTFMTQPDERAAQFEALLAAHPGITAKWGCTVKSAVVEDGRVCGVTYVDAGGKTVRVDAGAVISCGGGFIANDEMKHKYYGGSTFVSMGFPTVNGSGIQMCMDAGAQIGKNFTVSVNEMGGCSFNATPQFSWIPGTGTNQAMYLFLLGGLLVNRAGERFVRESRLVTNMMFTGEPLVREGVYYVIMDQATIDKVSSEPLLQLFDEVGVKGLAPILTMGFQGFTCDALADDLATAQDEGWAFKADSVEELAEHFGLTNLAQTVESYNAIPDEGDGFLFLEPEYVRTVEEGPFYAIQYNPGSWCTIGGIRTDAHCRALNAEGEPVSGLYVAGMDADLWSVPYYQAGTAQGFSYASGLLAGETAAVDVLGA